MIKEKRKLKSTLKALYKDNKAWEKEYFLMVLPNSNWQIYYGSYRIISYYCIRGDEIAALYDSLMKIKSFEVHPDFSKVWDTVISTIENQAWFYNNNQNFFWGRNGGMKNEL